jgi:hypothetical protein
MEPGQCQKNQGEPKLTGRLFLIRDWTDRVGIVPEEIRVYIFVLFFVEYETVIFGLDLVFVIEFFFEIIIEIVIEIVFLTVLNRIRILILLLGIILWKILLTVLLIVAPGIPDGTSW